MFVAARASADFARDPAEGAREALRSLPKSVRRIYVMRATPETFGPEDDVREPPPARQARRSARPAPSRAPTKLLPDPQLRPRAAASRSSTSRSTCATRRKCPSVIGGVLVRKDGSHLTRAFAQTLGPFVLRALG